MAVQARQRLFEEYRRAPPPLQCFEKAIMDGHQRREHRHRHERPHDGEGVPSERQQRDDRGRRHGGEAAVPQQAMPVLMPRDIRAPIVEQSGIGFARFFYG